MALPMMSRFKKWLKLVKKAAPYKNVFSQIIDIILTKIRVNISPSEYYFYAFYKSGLTWKQRRGYVGLDGSLYWPYELNRLKFNVTLTSKYVQKNLLMGFGLPTPRLITTIGHDFQIKTLDELRQFLSDCRQDIVVKPISSMGGQNVLILNHEGGVFSMGGEEHPAEKIWQLITPQLKKGFLVEEKVSNNKQLAGLYPHSLNCFRVVTIKLPGEDWRFCVWGLKLGRGRSVVDNIGAGGIYVLLDRTGRTIKGYAKGYEQSFDRHPDTGAPLVGVKIEGSDAVKELGLEASRKFGFMGTIGWDIGLTEHGPVIIEGNNLWGPMDQKVNGGHITEELARGLKRHTLWSRWDRKRMFPHFNRKMKAFRE
jgi:hypothetical protein